MRSLKLIAFTLLCYIVANTDVFAANYFLITAPSEATYNTGFTVSIKYQGETAGSMRLGVSMTNMDCSVKSVYAGAPSNCTGSNCDIAYYPAAGIPSGTTLLTLSCKSVNSSASVKAFLQGGDAWTEDGMDQLSISSSTKKITINAATTTTKKTTTTTTTRRTTTGKTTTNKNTMVTTKNSGTTKKTTTTKTLLESENKTTSTTTTATISIPEEKTETITTTTTKNISDTIPDNLKLSSLKVVGYPFEFKQNRTNYSIIVAENVNEIYVDAESVDQNAIIKNEGIINIYGKNEIIVEVYNEDTKESIDYKISIERRSYNESIISFILNNSKLIIIFGSLLILIAVVMLLLIKRTLKKDFKLDRIDNINIEYERNNSTNSNVLSDNDFIELEDNDLTKIYSDKK